jgi:outer membrane protein TolC
LATDAVSDARGQRWQTLSELLPNVITDTGFGVHQVNVNAAFGLTIHGEPPIIGPFGYFDSRADLTQSAFDWESIERARSSTAQVKSAEFSSKDAREIVVLVIVSNYLLVIADQSEVESATSQRDTAKALSQQTSDQKTRRSRLGRRRSALTGAAAITRTETIRIGASTRRRTVLYGHLLGVGCTLFGHVRSCVFLEEK